MRKIVTFTCCIILYAACNYAYAENTDYAEQWGRLEDSEKYNFVYGVTIGMYSQCSALSEKNNDLHTLNKCISYVISPAERVHKLIIDNINNVYSMEKYKFVSPILIVKEINRMIIGTQSEQDFLQSIDNLVKMKRSIMEDKK